MQNITADTLAALDKADLIALLGQVLTGTVAQAPAKAPAKPKCEAIASSTGERCTRNATQGDTCKSHIGWDNDEARAKFAKSQEFIASRREAAIAKGKGKGIDNKALAASLRSVGVQPNGEPWAKAKAHVAAGLSYDEAALEVAADA